MITGPFDAETFVLKAIACMREVEHMKMASMQHIGSTLFEISARNSSRYGLSKLDNITDAASKTNKTAAGAG